jgi:hypothetical protein
MPPPTISARAEVWTDRIVAWYEQATTAGDDIAPINPS